MMKRTLLCALLASGATIATGSAMAASLPSRVEAPPPYIAPVPIFTWTGFYIGVNAGAAFDPTNNVTFTPGGPPGSPNLNPAVGNNNTNFTGGVEAGYNWQVNSFVFGLEGDVDYLGGNNSLNGTFASPPFYALYPTYTLAGATRSHVFGTIRGRLGFAVDRALFYVTGGAAFSSQKAPTSIAFAMSNGVVCGPCTFTGTPNNQSVGAVVGGGIEYAFTNNWSAKVEYLHTFFGNKSVVYTNSANQTFTMTNNNMDTNIVRAGLNYHF